MLCVSGVVACATASSSSSSGPLRWSGDFRNGGGYSSAILSPGTPADAAGYGNVVLTPEANVPDRTRVDLSVSVRLADEKQLGWAVLMGRCGSAPAPVTGLNEFPIIDVGNNGTGSVRAVLPFALDEHASYHANVYKGSRNTDEGEVMMCANLERTGKR